MAGAKACFLFRTICPILPWAGRQQASRKTYHHAIKRQRPCLDERFAHKCCQAAGLMNDIMDCVHAQIVTYKMFTALIMYMFLS